MATVHGILGQSAPTAGSLTAAYTVPSGKHATVKVIVANRGSVPEGFRVAVSPNGVAIAAAHYITYDQVLDGNDSVSTTAFTLGDTDVVRVYSTGGNLSFNVTGMEEDN